MFVELVMVILFLLQVGDQVQEKHRPVNVLRFGRLEKPNSVTSRILCFLNIDKILPQADVHLTELGNVRES